MRSVPLVGLSTCGETAEPVAKPCFANSLRRETALHVYGAWFHGGKPELSAMEITTDPVTGSVLAIPARDDEYCMTMNFDHI